MERPTTWDVPDPHVGKGTETDFNFHMRDALMGQGFNAIHVRETNEPGKADLLVYEMGGQPIAGVYHDQVICAWLELKMTPETTGSNIRPAQREFMRQHWQVARNALFVMYDPKTDLLVLRQGDLRGSTGMVQSNPFKVNWREVFERFKRRKVSCI